ERIQRFVGDLAIASFVRWLIIDLRTARGASIVKVRLLSGVLRNAHRQPAAGTVIAEQHIGDGIAGLGPEKPGRDDCLRITRGAFKGECATVPKQNNYR